MKHLKFYTIVLFAMLLTACSSDDDNSDAYENHITVGDSVFEMHTAIVEPSLNSVFLSLTNSTEAEIVAASDGATLSNVDVFTARISYLDLTPGVTYELSEISSLEFIVNGSIVGGEFENGISQFYKSGSNVDLEVTQGHITITEYDVDVIRLSFTFTRADGVAISGDYEGSFIYVDSNNLN